MVLRRCVAGAVVVTGVLAFSDCTIVSQASHGNSGPATAPPAVAAQARPVRRVVAVGQMGQLVTTGAALRAILRSEASGPPGRFVRPAPARAPRVTAIRRERPTSAVRPPSARPGYPQPALARARAPRASRRARPEARLGRRRRRR